MSRSENSLVDKQLKVNSQSKARSVRPDEPSANSKMEVNEMWFKNWECFIRTVAYQKYKDSDLEYCKIENFRNKSYISVCVKN